LKRERKIFFLFNFLLFINLFLNKIEKGTEAILKWSKDKFLNDVVWRQKRIIVSFQNILDQLAIHAENQTTIPFTNNSSSKQHISSNSSHSLSSRPSSTTSRQSTSRPSSRSRSRRRYKKGNHLNLNNRNQFLVNDAYFEAHVKIGDDFWFILYFLFLSILFFFLFLCLT